MSTFGKSINLYLMDGSVSGRWQATLSNWNGRAYKIPRTDLKKSTDLEAINSPGVYFLFGKDDESGRQFIYVGEADEVLKRLLQPHTFENDGTYWTEAVAFVTPDKSLEKGRVKYLENRFYTIAKDAKRYMVKNGNTPKKSPVSMQIQDLLEEFILNVRMILPALGYLVLEPQPSDDTNTNDKEEGLLYFSRSHGKGGNATGRVSSDGFWVLKGSYIYPEVAEYTAPGIKKARKQYADKINKDGILQEDISFGSPSYASAFVCGKSSNGLTEWKNKEGISLKKLDSGSFDAVSSKSSRKGKEPELIGSIGDRPDLLHLAGRKAEASGYIDGTDFVVCKGSEFSLVETKSCQEWIRDQRKRLMEYGKVIDGKFTEDVRFKSPSAAAACILGASANGTTMWIYQDGLTIKDRQRLL